MGRKNFFRKLAHAAVAPAAAVIQTVTKPIASAGLFGMRHGNFRVAGVRIGSDLAPVVGAAVTLAATAVGGPTAGALANTSVSSACGASKEQISQTIVSGGALTAAPISTPIDVSSTVSAVTAAIAPNNVPAPLIGMASVGAAKDPEHPIRSSLQMVGASVLASSGIDIVKNIETERPKPQFVPQQTPTKDQNNHKTEKYENVKPPLKETSSQVIRIEKSVEMVQEKNDSFTPGPHNRWHGLNGQECSGSQIRQDSLDYRVMNQGALPSVVHEIFPFVPKQADLKDFPCAIENVTHRVGEPAPISLPENQEKVLKTLKDVQEIIHYQQNALNGGL